MAAKKRAAAKMAAARPTPPRPAAIQTPAALQAGDTTHLDVHAQLREAVAAIAADLENFDLRLTALEEGQ